MAQNKCFLCRKKLRPLYSSKTIKETFSPSSGKCLDIVITHLAKVAGIEIHIAKDDTLCKECYLDICDYDDILLRFLKKQKVLVEFVEKSLIDYDDIDETCNTEFDNFEQMSDISDVNISDSEIQEIESEFLFEAEKKTDPIIEKVKVEVSSGGSNDLKCSFCAMHFKNKQHFQKHLVIVHKKYGCDLCDYNHRNPDYVKLHMNTHEGKSENQCRYCDKVFSRKISTMRHMEVHMDTKKYQCDKCGLCFSQSTIMYNHKLQHEAEDTPLKCEICAQMFKTKRTYRHHMLTHKVDRPRHACEFCGKSFTEKYTLKIHKKTHHGAHSGLMENEKSFLTPQPLMANTSTEPQANIESTIEVNSLLQCVICSEGFGTKGEFNVHMEKEHDVIVRSLSLNAFSQYIILGNEEQLEDTNACSEYH